MTTHRTYLTPVRPAHHETFDSFAARVLLANHETPQHAAAMTRRESPSTRKQDMDATWNQVFSRRSGHTPERFAPGVQKDIRHTDGSHCDSCVAPLPATRTMCSFCSHGGHVTQHRHFESIVCVHHRRWVGLRGGVNRQHRASDAHIVAALQLAKLRRKGLVDPRLYVLVVDLFDEPRRGKKDEYNAFPQTVDILTVLTSVPFQRSLFDPTNTFKASFRILRNALGRVPETVVAGVWLYLRPTFHAVHQAVYSGTVYEPRWAHDLRVRPAALADHPDVGELDAFKNYITALTDVFPDVDVPRHIGAERPDPDRPDTHLLVICDNGHEFHCDRTKPSTLCPSCNNVPFDRSIAARPHLVREYVTALNGGREPQYIYAGTSEKLWWKCGDNHTWEATASNRLAGHTSCPTCRYKTVEPGVNDLASTDPGVAVEWDHDFPTELTPSTVNRRSYDEVGWKCENGHRYAMKIVERVKGGKCLDCAKASRHTLAATHPDLVAEWHPVLNDHGPEMYTYGSRADVFWKCKEGHTFRMRIERRTTGHYNCGRCTNRQLAPGYNDLRTTDPELASEYVDELNERASNRVIASNLSYWWTCKRNDHTSQQNIPNRRKSGGCHLLG
ncbi:MAG: zinc-ribbon domain-containing protein [Rhodococcus sp. (in: high G+C Gram-positive bacteria)]